MRLVFTPQFVDPILSGTKIHTIRKNSDDEYQAGTSLEMLCEQETAQPFTFWNDHCRHTQSIEIKYPADFKVGQSLTAVIVKIDNVHLTLTKVAGLAQNDGFPSMAEFFDYFSEDYKGDIIHWTDYEYSPSFNL